MAGWRLHKKINTPIRRAQSTERRFSRWLTNKHIIAQHVYTPLITQALQEWGEYEFRLALDTSLVFETHCICLGPTAAPYGLGPHPNRCPVPRSCRSTRSARDCPCQCECELRATRRSIEHCQSDPASRPTCVTRCVGVLIFLCKRQPAKITFQPNDQRTQS